MTRFHLIDRIDAWTPGVHLSGRKLVSCVEGPALPRPLVLESLCQAGTWLVLLSSDYRRRAALLAVEEVRFGADVRPGDVLLLEASLTSWSEEAAVLDGTVRAARSGGEVTVLTARGIMCALMDAAVLEDPAETRRMGERLAGGVS